MENKFWIRSYLNFFLVYLKVKIKNCIKKEIMVNGIINFCLVVFVLLWNWDVLLV